MARRVWTRLGAALLCAFLVTAALSFPWAGASGEPQVYQLAVNETFVDKGELSAANMPLAVNGTIYVPYTTFDKNVTGVDLGVSCLQYKDDSEHTLTLFSLKGTLVFDIDSQTCLADGDPTDMRAIVRNGKTYVPANGVCQFFGLQYSYRPTRTSGVLIRIKNGYAALNDEKFINSATSYMQGRYDRYLAALNAAAAATATPSPTRTMSSVQSPAVSPSAPEDEPDVRAYLAFRCVDDSSDLDRILSVLDQRGGRKALFLFRPEDLSQRSAQVRQALGRGHQIGLLVDGSSAETALAQLEEGNEVLARLIWSRCHIAALDGGSRSVRQSLSQSGWRVWDADYSGSRALRVTELIRGSAGKKYTVRLELEDSSSTGAALDRLIRGMVQKDYDLRPVWETELD